MVTLDRARAAVARPAVSPVVLVDGHPEPRLRAGYWTLEGPLDHRRLTLLAPPTVEEALRERWMAGRLTVAMPERLVDDEVFWRVLAAGRLTEAATYRSAGQVSRRFRLVDDWEARLADRPAAVPWVDHEGRLVAGAGGVLRFGDAANRSRGRFEVDGRAVHVLQARGEPWTVKTALETIAALGGLALSLDILPKALGRNVLDRPVDLSETVEAALAPLLSDHGLVVQRELAWVAGQTIERRAVRPRAQGRPVTVPWEAEGREVSEVIRLEREKPAQAARRYVAEGEPWIVEETFELVGGWDPALEGANDAEYGRTTSSDFARYGNVYRRWVLNEDGRFSESPYDRGDPFDLTAFFGQGAIPPQPLRFDANLTLDDAGRRQPAVVEVSADGGQSWQRYGADARLLVDRAGVQFTDATLPSDFLTAAQDGAARVRVTASLQSPRPVTATRWRGNPFVGQRAAHVLAARQFRFRRVAAGSLHRDGIDAGELAAMEADDARALSRWLHRQMEAQAELTGRATVVLSGLWPDIRPGDRLRDAAGRHRRLDGRSQSMAEAGAVVDSLTVRFEPGLGDGPSTAVRVRF
jgi:hypothetical protein